jgi:NAD(P)H-hydrate epimerase
VKKGLIDGDGLFHLTAYRAENALDPEVQWILTPHFKEASRLAGMTVQEIAAHRIGAAEMVARKYGCIALLKGPASIVSDGDRRSIVTSGNQALATAGSGDVLSGIIGALLLRRLSALDAAATGAWLHGAAADLHQANNSPGVMKSTDLLVRIREAMASLLDESITQ